VCGRKVKISSECFQERNFIQAAAADTRGLFVAFHNREETSSSSCGRNKAPISGFGAPLGSFMATGLTPGRKPSEPKELTLSLLVLIVRATSMSDHAFLFDLRDARSKTHSFNIFQVHGINFLKYFKLPHDCVFL
jgi:hypothetical protein